MLNSCQPSPPLKEVIQVDLSEKIVIPKHYIVSKSSARPEIDGKDDDEAWSQARWSDSFIDIEGIKTPKYETRYKMLWDEEYLYVYAKLMEPHIWGDITEPDAVIFYNNDFEVFLDPSGDTYNYGEIEINALNTVWDLMLSRPYRVGSLVVNHWNLNKLKSAVFVKGSLNDPSDIDEFWSVEIAIPIKALSELRGSSTPPDEGEQWRINFSRVQWDHEIQNNEYSRKKVNDKFLPEYNWVWSNQKIISMHEPEKWGYLQFTEADSDEGVDFINDALLRPKQVVYALFREVLYGDLKYLKKKDPQEQFEVTGTAFDSTFSSVFTKTQMGFEISLTDDNSKNTFLINEKGYLKIKSYSDGK